MELRMVEIVSIQFLLIKFGNALFLICLMMHNILTVSFFCLADVVITLRNYPRGESSRDATVLNIVRLVLQTEFSDVRFDSPIIYNNLIAPDITIRQTGTNGPEVAGHSSTERSNQAENRTETPSKISDIDEEECPVPQASATVEDSEEEPARSSRRKRKKRKQKAAAKYFHSSSENDRNSRPSKRRKHKHSVQTKDSKLPGCARTRKELAGRKRPSSKGWLGKGSENATKHTDAKNKDAEGENLIGMLQTRRKTYKRPGQDEGSPGEEPVPGPSGKNTGLLKKGKNFQFKAKPPSKDSKASAKDSLTERKKRKRPRKDDKNPTNPTKSASTTDSEEEYQPKRLRTRKKKDK